MCGIFAACLSESMAFSTDGILGDIKHRGPDDHGWFVSDNGDCQLGQVRLSIIDLSDNGHQPMSDSIGRYTLVFNGEIYNYQELKSQLESKHGLIGWQSSTDTEVILEGFAREGVQFLSRLNGVFALSIYDAFEASLYVLRDPLGVKPLFSTAQYGSVYLCSELKGLLGIKRLKRTLRHQSLAEQLAFMYVPEPHTLFDEFNKVVPGVCTIYTHGKKTSEIKLFEHLHDVLEFSSERDVIDSFKNGFSAAVKRQLVADVPISIMLSGGLDSSAVAYEAVHAGANIRDAYTISFSAEDTVVDQQSDDLKFARIMAERLGLELNVIQADSNFVSLLPQLSRFLEDGVSDPAAINTYLICQAASDSGAKVMMSGQGADEFLGGYRRYSAERMISQWPDALRSSAQFVGRVLPGSLPGRFNAVNRRLKRLLSLAGQECNDRMLGMYTWASSDTIAGLFQEPDEITVGDDLLKYFNAVDSENVIDSMMKVDQKFDLMSLNLTYTDRMSMAVGVEARVPFLDFNLVHMMNAMPSTIKMKNGMPKYVLKKAMESSLPKNIIYREKAGFGLPLRSWMRQENDFLRHYFDASRLHAQGIFNPVAVNQLYTDNLAGKGDYSNALFSLLCIQVWLDTLNDSETNLH